MNLGFYDGFVSARPDITEVQVFLSMASEFFATDAVDRQFLAWKSNSPKAATIRSTASGLFGLSVDEQLRLCFIIDCGLHSLSSSAVIEWLLDNGRQMLRALQGVYSSIKTFSNKCRQMFLQTLGCSGLGSWLFNTNFKLLKPNVHEAMKLEHLAMSVQKGKLLELITAANEETIQDLLDRLQIPDPTIEQILNHYWSPKFKNKYVRAVQVAMLSNESATQAINKLLTERYDISWDGATFKSLST